MTNFDQNAVYTIKVVRSFNCSFKILVGILIAQAHISRIMDPIDEQCFAFCNLICILLHDYQMKAGDKANASLDKGLVAPPSSK